ncbi:cytochrome P450 [Trametes polyzona]|nr:cytochrome P450 [Trametes polyzona]
MIVWICTILVLAGWVVSHRRRLANPYPPGPPGLPIIGSILHFPTSDFARRFHGVVRAYDGLAHFRLLGRSVVVIDSYDAANELLDKRARNYSDRPRSVMTALTELDHIAFPLMPYGPEWRRHRQIFQQTLKHDAVHNRYRPHIQHITRDLLLSLLEDPKRFSRHIHHSFAASVLYIGYGIKVARDDDTYVTVLDTATRVIEDVASPGKYPVEALPVLRYLPSWLPGVRFKKDAREVRETVNAARRLLFEHGRSLLANPESSNDATTMLATMVGRISSLDGPDAVEEENRSTGALITAYIAGSDTSVASLKALFLAMAITPDVQKKAQEELDRVVGRNRLPDFEDRDNLPYINAIVKELTRWNIVTPLALPHASVEDDQYKGYFIPKGSIMIANTWAISRDPAVYPDPEAFRPERFLDGDKPSSGARDPYSYIFGFGRRICPGRYLADASLFLTCASTLHAFQISPPVDDQGRPVKLEVHWGNDSIVSHLQDFDCVVEPRWPGAADLIRA